MAVIWFTGAEHTNVSADFSGSTGTVLGDASIAPRTGTYAWRLTGNSTHGVTRALGADAHATVTVGFAYQCTSMGSNSSMTVILYGDVGTTVHTTVFIDNSLKQVRIYRGTVAGSLLGSSIVSLPYDTGWHYWEITAVLGDTTTGSVDVRLNNIVVASTGPTDTKNAGTLTVYDYVGWSTPNNGNAFATALDDLYIANGTTGFLGDIKIYPLRPSGNGNSSQLVGSDGNSTDNYLLVDEPTPSSVDYTGSAVVGDKDTYALPDLPTSSSTVFGIKTTVVAAKSDAGAKSARIVTRTNSTDYGGADLPLSTSYLYFVEYRIINPDTGIAWTPTEINALQTGFEVRT